MPEIRFAKRAGKAEFSRYPLPDNGLWAFGPEQSVPLLLRPETLWYPRRRENPLHLRSAEPPREQR